MCMPNFSSKAQNLGWTYFWSAKTRKNVGTFRKKRRDLPRKNGRSENDEIRRANSLWANCANCAKKKRRNPMYVRKIMVCNVTNFSYNRGPPGGGLYCGSIGSIKDRCVIGTCEKNNFFRFPLWTRVWHLKCLQDIQWECFMKTRGQNIQKRPITDRPKIFRRTGRVPSQNVYSNLYSQAVTHPSTNRSQPWPLGRELVYSR